jgi:uracil-DNA glycosylase
MSISFQQIMNVRIEESWKKRLEAEFEKPYFSKLIEFVKSEYASTVIYPPGKLIFNAFDKCSFDNTKVVILGQDPYHGVNQANGLSFSVNDGVQSPPSLQNIFKEIKDDLDIPIPRSGNLERWASQGVLLLNSTLTVRAGEAGSHQKKGWETFTDAVIKCVSEEKEDVVFMLWGKYAQDKGKVIDESKHCVLKAKHPSPMAANYGGWFGTKHFSQANNYLINKGLTPIQW